VLKKLDSAIAIRRNSCCQDETLWERYSQDQEADMSKSILPHLALLGPQPKYHKDTEYRRVDLNVMGNNLRSGTRRVVIPSNIHTTPHTHTHKHTNTHIRTHTQTHTYTYTHTYTHTHHKKDKSEDKSIDM
jgi:hypothetical protein